MKLKSKVLSSAIALLLIGQPFNVLTNASTQESSIAEVLNQNLNPEGNEPYSFINLEEAIVHNGRTFQIYDWRRRFDNYSSRIGLLAVSDDGTIAYPVGFINGAHEITNFTNLLS